MKNEENKENEMSSYDPLDIKHFSPTDENKNSLYSLGIEESYEICIKIIKDFNIAERQTSLNSDAQYENVLPKLAFPLFINFPLPDLKQESFDLLNKWIVIQTPNVDNVLQNRILRFSLDVFNKLTTNTDQYQISVMTSLTKITLKPKFVYEKKTWDLILNLILTFIQKSGKGQISKDFANTTMSAFLFSGLYDQNHIAYFDSITKMCSTHSEIAKAWQTLFMKVCSLFFPTFFTYLIRTCFKSAEITINNIEISQETVSFYFKKMLKQIETLVSYDGITPISFLAFNAVLCSFRKIRDSFNPIFRVRFPIDTLMNFFAGGIFYNNNFDRKFQQENFPKVITLLSNCYFQKDSKWYPVFQAYIRSHIELFENTFETFSTLSPFFTENHIMVLPFLPQIYEKLFLLPTDFNSSECTSEWCSLIMNIISYIKAKVKINTQNDKYIINILDSDSPYDNESLVNLYNVTIKIYKFLRNKTDCSINLAIFLLIDSEIGDLESLSFHIITELLKCSSEVRSILQIISFLPIINPASYSSYLISPIFQADIDSPYVKDWLISLLLLSSDDYIPNRVIKFCQNVIKYYSGSVVICLLAERLSSRLTMGKKYRFSNDQARELEKREDFTLLTHESQLISMFESKILIRSADGIFCYSFRKGENDDSETHIPLDLNIVDPPPFETSRSVDFVKLKSNIQFLYSFGLLGVQNGKILKVFKNDEKKNILDLYEKICYLDTLEISLFRVNSHSFSVFECQKASKAFRQFLLDFADDSIYYEISQTVSKYKVPVINQYETRFVFLSQFFYPNCDITEKLKKSEIAIIFNETDHLIQNRISDISASLIIAVSIIEKDIYKIQAVKQPTSFVVSTRANIPQIVSASGLRCFLRIFIFSYIISFNSGFFVDQYRNRREFLTKISENASLDDLLSFVFHNLDGV